MISVVEFRRLLNEWKLRFARIKSIVQPVQWGEQEWKQFARLLIALVERNGASWKDEAGTSFWDLRWNLKESGTLIVQAQTNADQSEMHLVVAQEGGFVEGTSDSYTWFWAAFNAEGEFIRDPYWVDGTWKEALLQFILPYNYQAGFYLTGAAATPEQLLLENNGTAGYHDKIARDAKQNQILISSS
ncbi:hypothetical protein QPK87_11405 [Kamptonema cortianum]|nr:hypothetical protein [Oscillatoria laete-virens]MDK3157180.1 hypothetical protein [Kamptonema cortianum]MDL5054432.1 hypothetical protein [Oscillatoria laete-virens NRMC-F 0139]